MKNYISEGSYFRTLLLRCEKVYLELRGIGFVFWIPFLVNYVVFGLTILAHVVAGNTAEAYYADECNFYIPLMSAWWMLMTFKEYVEGEGCEILWLHDKGKIVDMVLLFLLYCVSWFPLWKIYSVNWGNDVWNNDGQFMIMLLARCLFYYGVAFALLMLSKTLVVPLLFVLIYSLYSNNLFYVNTKWVVSLLSPSDAMYFILGAIGLVIGCVFMTKLRPYK